MGEADASMALSRSAGIRSAWQALALLLTATAPIAHAAAASGIKTLYVYDNQTLTRTPQDQSNSGGTVIAGAHSTEGTLDWTLVPAIATGKALTLTAGQIQVNLALACSQAGQTTTCAAYDADQVSVELLSAGTSIATSAPQSVLNTAPGLYTFTLTVGSDFTVPAGGQLILRIHNAPNTTKNGKTVFDHPDLIVYQYYNAPSTISFGTSTVINVDSVNVYSATYPATSTQAYYPGSSTVYVRAVISDPFGSFDVTSADLTLTDSNGVTQLASAAMAQKADSGVATKTFEYAYTLPGNVSFGSWKASVTGHEGTENTVTHTASATFGVGTPPLALTISHSGNFTAGLNGSYNLAVSNNGAASITGPTTVADTLPGGLSYVSASGTGWACSASGQTVTCSNSATIGGNASLPALTLNVAVAGNAANSTGDTASLSNPNITGSVSGNVDVTTIDHPDLSSSTQTVVDTNGGDTLPGDTLQYTITLTESAGGTATDIAVTDALPAGTTSLAVVSVPAGSTDSSTATGLNVTGITVPASGSVTIVYDVTVASGDTVGQTIGTTAAVTNPDGAGATPAAPDVTVSQSQTTASGNKILYVYDNQTLTRTPQQPVATGGVVVPGVANGVGSLDWTLMPVLAAPLTLSAGTITFQLMMACTVNATGECQQYGANTSISVELLNGTTSLGTSAVQTFFNTAAQLKTFTITLNAPVTIPAGGSLVLRIHNDHTFGNPDLTVFQYTAATASTITFDTSTVIHVDSVNVFSAAYPATTTKTLYQPNTTIYVRAVISDPFGSYDANRANLTLTDSDGVVQLNGGAMTVAADSGAATRTFEYAYHLANGSATGAWTASVTGHEGTENPGVTHTANAAFTVGVPQLSATVSHSGDFTAGTTGSYNIIVHNSGGTLGGTTTVADVLPAGLSYTSATGTGWTCSASGQTVTCASSNSIAAGADLPTLTLNATVGKAAANSVDNSATVSNPNADGGNAQTSNIDTATVLHSDLSSSTQTVVANNGGRANPGDTLRYTITLMNTGNGAASSAAVTADIPSGVTGFAVVSTPAGSIDASSATGGTNGTGLLDITGISVPVNGSVTIVYNVTIATGDTSGQTIDNAATITNPGGPAANPAAPAVIVSFGVNLPPLSVTTSHNGNFTVGTTASYSLLVRDNGPDVAGPTTVTDTLPSGLGSPSASGSGWTCTASGQTVSCTNAANMVSGDTLPTLTVDAAVLTSVPASVSNTATVANPNVNGDTGEQGNTDTAIVIQPDLSTSTQTVVDTNGGDANPGDTLQYTITLKESAGGPATSIGVSDTMAATVGSLSVVSLPAGATDASTAGQLNVSGITVPANGSVTIVYNVTVASGDTPGQTVNSAAIVTNPNGPGATPAAPTVTVSQSEIAASGNKILYVYDDKRLTRTPQAATNTTGITIAAGATADWMLTPALAKNLTLSAGTIAVNLVMQCSGTCASWSAGQASVELRSGTASLGTSATKTFVDTNTGMQSFSITLSADTTVAAGDVLVLRVHNNSTAGSGNNITIFQYNNAASKITFATSTVIHVDSVNAYSAAYPTTSTKAYYNVNDTAYIRAVISDPFGSSDVHSANVTLTDANGTVLVNAANMTQVADSGNATRTFEYAYTLPNNVNFGFWTASVTGHEGTEGTVTHTANGSFGVGVPQLSVTTSHVGDFTAGTDGSYSIAVHNNGSGVSGTTTVTDDLPSGLNYVATGSGGTGWNCGASGQTVTCTNTTAVAGGGDLPALTVNVAITGSAANSIDNVAEVANPMVNGGVAYAGNIDTTAIVHPDLSTSTNAVVDTNGGDANPGDTLQYTITLINTSSGVANNVGIADTLSSAVSGFSLTSKPAGSSETLTGNSLSVTGISVPANSSVTVVYTVIVANGDLPGQTIDNTATITNPNGAGATAAARTVVVSQSQVAASGNKLLYVYDSQQLTRTPQPAVNTTGVAVAAGGSQTWTLSPALAKNLVLSAGSIAIKLVVGCPTCGAFASDQVSAQLLNGATPIGTTGTVTISSATTGLQFFTVTLSAATTIAAGGTLALAVTNNGTHAITIFQYDSGASTIKFATSTVVNVDSVAVYAKPYPDVTTQSLYVPNNTVYVRAVVSDPFGYADVGNATITLTDSTGTVKLNSGAMTEEAHDTATKTFEYSYILPNDAAAGSWTALVAGNEGTEGTVSDTGSSSFNVGGPELLILKAVTAVTDPVEGTANAKALPGATMQYSVTISNNGDGPADSNSLVVTDPIASDTKFVLGSVVFSDGTTSSGLTLGASDVSYSDDGGVTWTYTPVDDGTGADPAVTDIRISPQGALVGKTTAIAPSFTISFRVLIK